VQVVKKAGYIVILSLLLAVSPLCASRLGQGEVRALKWSPGVVLVVVTYQVTVEFQVGEQPQKQQLTYTETGSGFIYRPDGYIITNGHVVADANLKDAQAMNALETRLKHEILDEKLLPAFERHLGRPLTGADRNAIVRGIRISCTTPQLRVFLSNNAQYNANIMEYSDPITQGGKDVAVLKIDANNLPTVELGNSDEVRVQEPVTVIGYPGAASPLQMDLLSNSSIFVPTVTNGHISALKVDNKGTPVIQSDAAITHGNSGGPAFNEKGQVIGIATFGPGVAGFNFFVPINTALEFVRAAGAAPFSGAFNPGWAEALTDYDSGRCETAKNEFQDLLRILPNQPDVTRLLAAATSCSKEEGKLERHLEDASFPLYGAGALAALVVAGIVLVRRTRRAVRPRSASAAASTRVGPAPKVPCSPFVAPSGESQNVSYGNLQITSGPLAGKLFKIAKEGLRIGRDPEQCTVVLNEDTVSKSHAWIVPVDNRVVVIDGNSSNGTYINSVNSPRVSKAGLRNGDRIYMGKQGSTVLTYFN
jgi:serine protease Do